MISRCSARVAGFYFIKLFNCFPCFFQFLYLLNFSIFDIIKYAYDDLDQKCYKIFQEAAKYGNRTHIWREILYLNNTFIESDMR